MNSRVIGALSEPDNVPNALFVQRIIRVFKAIEHLDPSLSSAIVLPMSRQVSPVSEFQNSEVAPRHVKHRIRGASCIRNCVETDLPILNVHKRDSPSLTEIFRCRPFTTALSWQTSNRAQLTTTLAEARRSFLDAFFLFHQRDDFPQVVDDCFKLGDGFAARSCGSGSSSLSSSDSSLSQVMSSL